MGAWIACLNETLNTRLGHVTPLLYRPELAKTFEAVVRGDNDITSAVGGFHADAGWDPCTGLGAPSPRLLAALTKLHAQTDTSSA
jgi:kumamolisin